MLESFTDIIKKKGKLRLQYLELASYFHGSAYVLMDIDSLVPLSLLGCSKPALRYLIPLLTRQLKISSRSIKQWLFLQPI